MAKTVIIIIVIIIISWIFMQIVLPNIVAAKISANDYEAYLAIQKIKEACYMYKEQHGVYPQSLAILGAESNLLTKDLAKGKTHGYHCYCKATKDGFIVNALPIKRNYTGRFAFEADEAGNIVACDENAKCISVYNDWHPPVPLMSYPYKLGDGCIE